LLNPKGTWTTKALEEIIGNWGREVFYAKSL
jgi:hypothetical protein